MEAKQLPNLAASQFLPAQLISKHNELRALGYQFSVTSTKAQVFKDGRLLSFDLTSPSRHFHERLGQSWTIALIRADSHNLYSKGIKNVKDSTHCVSRRSLGRTGSDNRPHHEKAGQETRGKQGTQG